MARNAHREVVRVLKEVDDVGKALLKQFGNALPEIQLRFSKRTFECNIYTSGEYTRIPIYYVLRY